MEDTNQQNEVEDTGRVHSWKDTFVVAIGFVLVVVFLFFAFKAMLFSPSKPSDMFDENRKEHVVEDLKEILK